MHPEAWSWLEAEISPRLSNARRVLDVGGCDVNGSPRALFSADTDYRVLDARPGPNVHIVADAVTWLPPRSLRGAFDVALSTEVFEHVQHWRAILYNLWLALAPSGTCLVTCAMSPRRPHSIDGVEPPPPAEWYANVAPEDLLAPMRLLFRDTEWRTHPRGDLYARGVQVKIVVGTTAAGHKAAGATRWLTYADAMRALTPHDVQLFLAAEVRPDGLEPRLDGMAADVESRGGTVWKFMIDDGAERITGSNRLVRICEGRNLITEFALRTRADWVLFVDADIVVPADVLIKLLEVEHPFCGFKVGSYCLSGPPVPGRRFPLEIYQNTAGAWFLHRSLFRRFRWLWDPDDGLTDDPATYRVIRDQLHCEQYNRGDVLGDHGVLIPFEARDADTVLRRHPLAGHAITAVIPVYFPEAEHVEMTAAILDAVLGEAVARVYVIDNGGSPQHHAAAVRAFAGRAAQHGARLRVIDAPGFNIYQMWNLGWKASLADFGDEVLIAFLNNDIDFLPGTLEVLARAVLPNEIWATYPDPDCRVADGARLTGATRRTRGSKLHGGMTGHCFLIKGGIHTRGGMPLFDARYTSWYGDDDFAFRVDQHGYQIHRVSGLPCDHGNEQTLHLRPDLVALREADRQLFAGQWGEV